MVEKYSHSWGFKFSVGKTKAAVFTRKRVKEIVLRTYGQKLEQIKTF